MKEARNKIENLTQRGFLLWLEDENLRCVPKLDDDDENFLRQNKQSIIAYLKNKHSEKTPTISELPPADSRSSTGLLSLVGKTPDITVEETPTKMNQVKDIGGDPAEPLKFSMPTKLPEPFFTEEQIIGLASQILEACEKIGSEHSKHSRLKDLRYYCFVYPETVEQQQAGALESSEILKQIEGEPARKTESKLSEWPADELGRAIATASTLAGYSSITPADRERLKQLIEQTRAGGESDLLKLQIAIVTVYSKSDPAYKAEIWNGRTYRQQADYLRTRAA